MFFDNFFGRVLDLIYIRSVYCK